MEDSRSTSAVTQWNNEESSQSIKDFQSMGNYRRLSQCQSMGDLKRQSVNGRLNTVSQWMAKIDSRSMKTWIRQSVNGRLQKTVVSQCKTVGD